MNAKPTLVKFINSKGEWVTENCHDLSTCREHAEKLAATSKLLKANPAMMDFDDDSLNTNAMSIFDEDGMSRAEFLAKVERLQKAAEAYYAGTEQHMSDAEYDLTLDEVEEAAKKNGWTEAEGLTERVAAGYAAGTEVTHVKPMLSMAKVKNLSELEAFAKKIGGFSIEPKLDGLAVGLTYKEGKLVGAATRGDGIKGESILPQIMRNTVRNLEYELSEPVDVTIRGELYMTHADFEVANAERLRRTGQPFANSRNATAGIIRNQKTEDAYAVLSFAAYDVVGLNEKTYEDELAHATRLGFQTAASLLNVPDGTLAERVTAFGASRDDLDYPVDGIVIKASSLEVRQQLGEGAKTPNWAMAYKYEDEKKVTRLISIERAVGRTGAISYTAILDPVELEGTTVQRSTLNNANYIKENNIRVGGNVILLKANQIIPKIVSGVSNDSFPVYEAPKTCPNCKEDLDTTSSAVWRCLNPDCSTGSATSYWATRSSMDIDGLGNVIVDKLVENNIIEDITDLYKLKPEDIAEVILARSFNEKKNEYTDIKFGEDRAAKLIKNIQASRQQPLHRVLSALNIRHLGTRPGKSLENEFGTIEAIQNASEAELASVDKIGSIKAKMIYEGLKTKKDTIQKLKSYGVSMQAEKKAEPSASAGWIAGKKFVITGSFDNMNREELSKKLENLGGISSSSVSSNTDLLICGDKAGSKKAKAEQLGVRVIEALELSSLI
jgi:DNA ligase (NAD+)